LLTILTEIATISATVTIAVSIGDIFDGKRWTPCSHSIGNEPSAMHATSMTLSSCIHGTTYTSFAKPMFESDREFGDYTYC
jgi:hypothetical protein